MRSEAIWIVTLSLAYFADLFLKASQKCFWYDELFTVYLCRLPDLRQTWAAVVQGADYNPPVLYAVTRGVENIFGEGLIASRLPEMAGVWLFCICLYFFVSKHAGRLAGLSAALFPFFTVAQYYAYEARPHGIVLGACGLAMVCWQRSYQLDRRSLWALAFGLSLAAALLAHVYAVYVLLPFLAVELQQFLKHRQLAWSRIAAILFSAALALPVYRPLIRRYRTNVRSFADASHSLLRPFAAEVLGSTGVIVLLLFVAIYASGRQRGVAQECRIPQREILLALFLACLPVIGLAGAELTHGPFIFRYFLATIAGFAALLGFASSRRGGVNKVLCGVLLCLFVADFGRVVYWRIMHRDLALTEPSSFEFHFGPSPQNALARNASLLGAPAEQDIIILRDIEYLYLYQYAPPQLSKRLYFATPLADNVFLGEYQRLAALAHLPIKATTFASFLAMHHRFSVYATNALSSSECGACVDEFLKAGYKVKSAHRDMDGVLYEYQSERQEQRQPAKAGPQ